MVLFLVGCAGAETTRPGDDSQYAEQATARAHIDAQKAIDAPAGSMARENAILEIHARAHRLELTGDSATARVYLRVATDMLDSANIFSYQSR